MDIKTLKKICHAGKIGREDQPGWYFIHRNISILITRILIPFNIRPNCISVFMTAAGVAGSLLIGCRAFLLNMTGILVLYLSFLLDKVDGEVARYKQDYSVSGLVIDWMYHRIYLFGIYLCLCLKVFNESGRNIFIIGLLSAFFAILIEDNQNLSYLLYAQKLYKKRQLFVHCKEAKGKLVRNIFMYSKIMKVFRTNITLLYMLIPLYAAGLYHTGFFDIFIYLSLFFNTFYFILQTFCYFSYKRIEEMNQIDRDLVSYLEENYGESSYYSK
jgi:phosphatidylglycerophosphate synthase